MLSLSLSLATAQFHLAPIEPLATTSHASNVHPDSSVNRNSVTVPWEINRWSLNSDHFIMTRTRERGSGAGVNELLCCGGLHILEAN